MPKTDDEEEEDDGEYEEEYPPRLADKLRLLFDAMFPEAGEFRTLSVWCAGELLNFGVCQEMESYEAAYRKRLIKGLTRRAARIMLHLYSWLVLLAGESHIGTKHEHADNAQNRYCVRETDAHPARFSAGPPAFISFCIEERRQPQGACDNDQTE